MLSTCSKIAAPEDVRIQQILIENEQFRMNDYSITSWTIYLKLQPLTLQSMED